MKLGVNIDHIATLRQARGTIYPDPITAASIVENSGGDQITVHLREDRRHIRDADLFTLRKVIKTLLNLELAATDEIVAIACKARPDICTFVPEKRAELTTEGGLDVVKNFDKLRGYNKILKENSVLVSMFIDPEVKQVEASKELGADAIELHTGRYCELCGSAQSVAQDFSPANIGRSKDLRYTLLQEEIDKLKAAAIRAKELGLHVAAGHGLNYDNTSLIVKEVPEITEYNIGHAIVARAVFVGLAQAVGEMKKLVTT